MPPRERVAVQLICTDVSRAKQSMKDDCDINLIVDRHASRGMWDHLNSQTPRYGDFSVSTGLQEAFALIDAAEAEFMGMKPAVRAVVDNDPIKFAEAMADPDLFRQLVEAGMPATEEPREPAPIVGGETPGEPEN